MRGTPPQEGSSPSKGGLPLKRGVPPQKGDCPPQEGSFHFASRFTEERTKIAKKRQ